jgi:hypothetical protein
MIKIRNLLKKIDKQLLFSTINKLKKLYKINKTKKKKNKIINNLNKKSLFTNTFYSSNKKNLISELCEYYGSDKGYINYNSLKPYKWRPHAYSNIYYNLFNHCKNEIKLIFECGIGTNNPKFKSNMTSSGSPGASLRVWKDFFSNAKIYGADIDKDILFNEDRVFTYYVDQLNKESINKMWLNINEDNFDIIIDDGLHSYESNITFFINSFHKLREGGIYIIEDVHYLYLDFIMDKLKKFNPEIITLDSLDIKKNSRYEDKLRMDNNLLLFRKEI